MPNSISYEDEKGLMQEWTIPPLDKWISGDALPVYPAGLSGVTAEIIVDEETMSVNVFNPGTPMDIAEEFVDLGAEFRVFLMNILTKFLRHNLITQLVDTENMDFTNYHGSWSASWINDTRWKSSIPHSLLNTSGLYILLPNDPQKVKTTGLRVMYRQAQRYTKDFLLHGDPQDYKRNEIITIVFPPLSYDPKKKLDGRTGFGSSGKDKHDEVSYDSEPISEAWLKEQLADHYVLMVLGVKNETYPCLNWNLHQLHQLLSKITLSSRAS